MFTLLICFSSSQSSLNSCKGGGTTMLRKIALCRTLLSGPTVCLFPGISYLQDSGLLPHLLPVHLCQQSLLPAVLAEGQNPLLLTAMRKMFSLVLFVVGSFCLNGKWPFLSPTVSEQWELLGVRGRAVAWAHRQFITITSGGCWL